MAFYIIMALVDKVDDSFFNGSFVARKSIIVFAHAPADI